MTRDDVERLATYNSERTRGIVHTSEWQDKMKLLQQEFNEGLFTVLPPAPNRFWRRWKESL